MTPEHILRIAVSTILLAVTVDSVTAKMNSGSTVAKPFVPEWAKQAVWYQIFPERFRNSDPSNDPTKVKLAGAWPHAVADGWRISKWTGDWYEKQPWEVNDGKDFYFHVQQRRYGGDLQGVIEKLDYLKDLGITAIYFNPLFESPSLHKYDATCYHHIDRNFGPDPVGDSKIWAEETPGDPKTWKWTSSDKLFLKLVREAHKRGMRVVLDGVFNHVGLTFWAFEDVKEKQEGSKFRDWFKIKRWGKSFDYEGWNGVRELPEIREDDRGLVDGFRDHVHAVVRRWMDPNGDGNPDDGIDGWRLDVAEKVNLDFWREFRNWVRAINPQAYIVGEVWWEDWANDKMYNASPWLQGDAFDAVMNYRWARETMRYFAGTESKISASEFVRRLGSLLADYPTEADYALMNVLDSHDTDRLASHIVNGDLSYDKRVGVPDNLDYNVRKPNESERATQRLVVLFHMTYVGAPVVYYGDEAGMWGGDDPDCRKPMLWADLNYDDEKSHPRGKSRPVDKNVFDRELFSWYAQLIHLRTSHSALQSGSLKFLFTDDEKDVFAYLRSEGKNELIVVLNNSREAQSVTLTIPPRLISVKWKSLLDSSAIVYSSGQLVLPLAAKSGKVLEAIE